MRVCGIIAEYDPFHKGHLFQLNLARELSRADYMVCVLGCSFSQRGEAMLLGTFDRAAMALENGFDLVAGMPFSFSCAQANRFARGGVGTLSRMGLVNAISFGCETDRLDWLQAAAGLMNRPDAAYLRRLKDGLAAGYSFARAQGIALHEAMPELSRDLIASPNFILGLSYLRELDRLGSPIEAIPVKRATNYHSRDAGPMASAGAVRAMLLNGEIAGALEGCPENSGKVLRQALQAGRLHRPEALDRVLIAMLLEDRRPAIRRSPEVSEGLEDRIHQAARRAVSREELVRLVKTRRYPYARINRALAHTLVGMDEYPDMPPYARLLGFRKRAAPLLNALAQSGFPMVDRPARSAHAGLLSDMRAEELWALGAGLPPQSAWRQKVIVLDE